jgi:putative hydrolase of the HAD superfamily
MSNKIKAIIFDIGGVLQLGGKRTSGVHEEMAERLKVSIDQYFDAIDTIYAKSIEGKLSEERTLKEMAKNLKTTTKKLKAFYKTAYKKHFTLNKELLAYSLKKKKQGYKIAILSDQWWLSKEALITKIFYKNFNSVVVSTDVKLRKPNPKIYFLTLARLKVKARESVFIDNQKWNIKPAKKLGMKTVLFKNNKQAIKEIERILR